MKDNALYLEVDEDITSAIDKLTKSAADSVQIVVPKRSTMLQSIINLKLLKKAAQQNGKELVLVTNDRIATDLAARVGLAVAPSLGAKPVLAEAQMPAELKSNEEVIEAGDPEPPATTPEPPAAPAKPKRSPLRLNRREVGDGPPTPPAPEAPAAATTPEDPAAGKKKGPKVPNFGRLQRRLLWVGAAVLLVGGYILGMHFLTSAKVMVYANGTRVDIDTTFTADPKATATDNDKAVLAAQTVTASKDLSGSFTPTGKKDAGTKASGTITVSNGTGVDQPLVAGTRFAAPDGRIFRSNQDITVPAAKLDANGDKVNGTASVSVTADQAGDVYNEGPAAYTIPALSNPKITAHGEQMSGGTTKTVTVVTQADVDAAKQAILAKDKDNAARDLQGRLPKGYVALAASQSASTSNVVSSPAVEAEATSATLSLKVTYTELAVKKSEYQELVRAQELKQVGDENQIYDDGLDTAQVTAGDKDSSGRQTFHLTTEAFGGVKIDTAALATKVKGKRYGDAASIATHEPGVTRAEISIWPGWASNLPSRSDKITVKIQVEGNK